MTPLLKQFLNLSINALLIVLSKEVIQGFIESGLKALHDYTMKTETRFDDELVVPACNLVRAALRMPGEVDVQGEMNKLFEAIGDNYVQFIDAGLDFVEDQIAETATDLDDMTILPLLNMIRDVLQVPDNDIIYHKVPKQSVTKSNDVIRRDQDLDGYKKDLTEKIKEIKDGS